MSTYEFQKPDRNLLILVGWDAMLNTFFAHVIDTTKDEDEEGRDVLWVGCTPNEIHDMGIIENALTPYATFTSQELWTPLYADANT